MASTDNHILHDGRQRKADEAQEFLEERAHLLDTIREMINVEMDRRRVGTDNGNCQSRHPSETKPRKLTFLQWLRSLLVSVSAMQPCPYFFISLPLLRE